mmetsp:Transcript_3004/g.8833  ORF Transcript_3004/g.8833 Transcript_3004/m.8833 type:complete len:215 (-) Transcript_3004:1097-1741(-)
MKSMYLPSVRRSTGLQPEASRCPRQRGSRPAKPAPPFRISPMVSSSASESEPVRNQKRPSLHAARPFAVAMFSSILEIGTRRSRPSARIALESSTMMDVKAAFSKSVIWISIGRNSTRQPMWPGSALSRVPFAGCGGFQRSVCQFVLCRFSKWSTSFSSSRWSRSAKMTSGSRAKRCATWRARVSGTPLEVRRRRCSSSTAMGRSLKRAASSLR